MNAFPHLLVLAAMAEEEAAIHATLQSSVISGAMKEVQLGQKLPLRLHTYSLGSRTVMVARSGMGSVNAALALATVLEYCPIDAVILLGVGGSISPELRIGDLVLSRKVLQHDSYSSLRSGNFRMSPGHLLLSEDEARSHSAAIPADPELLGWVASSLPQNHFTIGTVVSGAEFVGTVERKLALRALDAEALLVEMEAAGVAQVAHKADIPFLVAKTVADRLHADGSIENDFRTCLESAARNAAELMHRVVCPP